MDAALQLPCLQFRLEIRRGAGGNEYALLSECAVQRHRVRGDAELHRLYLCRHGRGGVIRQHGDVLPAHSQHARLRIRQRGAFGGRARLKMGCAARLRLLVVPLLRMADSAYDDVYAHHRRRGVEYLPHRSSDARA